MTNIKQDIEILIKTQDLDRDLYLAGQQLTEIPEERARLKGELESEKQHLKSLEEELKKIQLKQREQEKELANKEANIKKFDGQLAQVKTNKEYSALQQEIASLKADNSVLEEEIIKIIDQVEAAEEEVKKERERLKEVEKKFQEREGELSRKEKTLNEGLESLKKNREETIQKVSPEVRNMYDAIVKKKQGLGLAPLNGETCGACQMQVRAQVINELQLGQDLILCEACSRILYVAEKSPEEAPKE